MDGAATTILIVDDQVDNLLVLTSLLKSHGYEVRKARGGLIALQTALVEPPDLILLDIRMPEINGYEVCTQLKANAATQHIPVIFLSALDEVDDRMTAFATGGVDYITKPFHTAEVLARIHCQLTIQQQHRRLLQQNQQLQQEVQERQQVETALRHANRELERLASLDSLTQIPNRRRLDEYLSVEWQQSCREQVSLSLLLCDVDCFKAYNDYYGHQAGDACLRQVAQTIHRTLRRSADLVARYGGEEFAIVLPRTDTARAVLVAERIQAAIGDLKIPHQQSRVSSYLSLSLGIWSDIAQHHSPDAAIMAADAALYAAKAAGRNRWCLYQPDQPTLQGSEVVIPAKS